MKTPNNNTKMEMLDCPTGRRRVMGVIELGKCENDEFCESIQTKKHTKQLKWNVYLKYYIPQLVSTWKGFYEGLFLWLKWRVGVSRVIKTAPLICLRRIELKIEGNTHLMLFSSSKRKDIYCLFVMLSIEWTRNIEKRSNSTARAINNTHTYTRTLI